MSLDRHRKKRWIKSLSRRRLGRGNGSYKPIVLSAPNELSFSRNSAQTIQFFSDLKKSIFSGQITRRKGKIKPQPFAIDLCPVKKISLPAAIVLAAELHRWSLTIAKQTSLTPRTPSKWAPRVRALLTDLGALELLGVKLKRREQDFENELVLLKLRSDVKRDGPAIQHLQLWLREMGHVFKEKPYVFGALDEAVMNCIEHGYEDVGAKPRYPNAGHRWWATSCFDPTNDSLRFFVYDQGVGIPASLPHNKDFWSHVSRIIEAVAGLNSESNIIEGAFEVGRTRTNLCERGKGLGKMQEAIQRAGDGYLRIISGRGDVTLSPAATIRKMDHTDHIGGTLIEWSIPIDALKNCEVERGYRCSSS